jgi:NADH dehydrogenase FAD-containing subunit
VGDAVLLMNPATKQPVPWLAQSAMAMGRVAAGRIALLLQKKRLAEEGTPVICAQHGTLPCGCGAPVYGFPVFPVVVPLGGKFCAAAAWGRSFVGFSGWVIHELATLRYFIRVMPFWRGVGYWWRGATTYAAND